MTDNDLEKIKTALRDLIQAERTAFWVAPEQHYLDHLFITRIQKRLNNTGSLVWATTVGLVVAVALAWLGQAVISNLIDMVKK